MAKVITDNKYYAEIAEAIREKAESTDTYKPSEMAEAIKNISGGGSSLDYNVQFKVDEEVKQITSIVNGMSISKPALAGYKWLNTDGAEIAFPYKPTQDEEIMGSAVDLYILYEGFFKTLELFPVEKYQNVYENYENSNELYMINGSGIFITNNSEDTQTLTIEYGECTNNDNQQGQAYDGATFPTVITQGTKRKSYATIKSETTVTYALQPGEKFFAFAYDGDKYVNIKNIYIKDYFI